MYVMSMRVRFRTYYVYFAFSFLRARTQKHLQHPVLFALCYSKYKRTCVKTAVFVTTER